MNQAGVSGSLASLESINLLVDDQLLSHQVPKRKLKSGSLDSLRNYLSSSPSSVSSENTQGLSSELPHSIDGSDGNYI